jgi:hypothetical protein
MNEATLKAMMANIVRENAIKLEEEKKEGK